MEFSEVVLRFDRVVNVLKILWVSLRVLDAVKVTPNIMRNGNTDRLFFFF